LIWFFLLLYVSINCFCFLLLFFFCSSLDPFSGFLPKIFFARFPDAGNFPRPGRKEEQQTPKSSKADFIPRFLSRLYAANRATMRFSRGARLKKSNPSIVILSFLVSLFSLILCGSPNDHTRREAKNTRLAFWLYPQTR